MTFLKTIVNLCKPHAPAVSRSVLQLLVGAAVGTLLLAGVARTQLFLGSNSQVLIALLATVSCAALLSRIGLKQRWSGSSQTVGFSLAAFWFLLQPSLLSNISTALQQLSLETVAVPASAFLLILVTTLLSIGPLCFATCWVVGSDEHADSSVTLTSLGLVLSWLILPVAVLSWLSLMTVAVTATIIGAAAICGLRVLSPPANSDSTEAPKQPSTSNSTQLTSVFQALLIGACFALMSHLGQLLFAKSLFVECTLFAGVVLGVLLTHQVLQWCQRSVAQAATGLFIASFAVALLLAYPLLATWATFTSTWVSTTSLIFATRAGLMLLMTIPLGICFGCTLNSDRSELSYRFETQFVFLSVGFSIAVLSGFATSSIVLTVVMLSVITSFLAWSTHRFTIPTHRTSQLAGVGAVAVIVTGCLLTSRYAPQQFERVLFSGQAFASLREGVEIEQITWMDDSRLTAQFESLQDRWSTWKHRSAQVVVRRNGLPIDYVSASPAYCPSVVSEVAPSLMPLVLHPAAEHVLVMGLHGSTLQTCAEFPLLSVTTIEEADGTEEIVASLIDQKILGKDAAQHVIQANSSLALQAKHDIKYDIIVAPVNQVLEADGAKQFLPGYYQAISSHLASQGIFSQRVPYFDLGPETVFAITKSLQQVFPQVIMVEPVAGELMFLATKHQEPLITERVVEQLQYPQARRVMSQIGWDWAVPLSRGSLSAESLSQLTQSTKPHNIRNGGLVFHLPVEVSRWGYKSQATRQTLAQHGKTLGTFLGDIPEAKDVAERLEDLRLAQNVLTDHPEQFWAYRSILKKQLKERPRAKVMTVNHEVKRALHPEDQRRKDYLIALGEAATEAEPTAEQIEAVSEFSLGVEFDPLVNYFVHHEVALLCERAAEPVPDLELFHRLRSIYFAPAQAKSVRDVCRAITLLAENESPFMSQQERWDHLNGLLEVMKQRWRLRMHDSQNRSTYEPIDTEKSIAAIDLALETLEQDRDQSQVSAVVWEIRKELVDDHLLRPLRRHRSNQVNGLGVPPVQQ